jgi:anhydro-N-acetylmuramic acid kinase
MTHAYYLGAISGTSLDGIDLALVALDTARLRERIENPGAADEGTAGIDLIAYHCEPFESELRTELLNTIRADAIDHTTLVAGQDILARVFAAAINEFVAQHSDEVRPIAAIGFHGPTLYHLPERAAALSGRGRGTFQWGDAHALAAACDLPVITEFRHADMARGGQGAPLASFLDHVLFRHPVENRVLLNLGGIANLTYLPAGALHAIAFDTGPANMLVDGLMRRHPSTPKDCDRDGVCAARGKVIDGLLAQCLADEYFARQPPKTTGRERFGDHYCEEFMRLGGNARHDDLVATATRLTAVSVARAIQRFAPGQRLIAAGGGIHNPTLMAMLRGELPDLVVETCSDHGLDADAKEAVLMALLAWAHDHRIPANLPSVTGADKAVVLGSRTG